MLDRARRRRVVWGTLRSTHPTRREDEMGWCRDITRLGCVCLLAVVMTATSVRAQSADYPSKSVTIICDAPAGSTPDVVARFTADGLGRAWHQQVVVINRPGGNGSIAAHAAA